MLPQSSRTRLFLVLAATLAVSAACIPKFGTQAGPLMHGVLTPDGGDVYLYETNGSTTTFRTPSTNQGGNLREFYWDTASPFYQDQESCNRWDSVIDSATPATNAAITRKDKWQPGVGLRIAPTEDGEGLRGISIDLNIWGDAWWTIQVNGWDSRFPSHPWTSLAAFNMLSIVGPDGPLYAPPPWNMCGQVYGDTLRVKVWIGNNPEPSWDDSTHVFITTLPPEWNYAGYPGGYVAHIAPATTKSITSLRTGVLMPDGSQPVVPPSSTTSPTTVASTSTTTIIPPTTTSAVAGSTTTVASSPALSTPPSSATSIPSAPTGTTTP